MEGAALSIKLRCTSWQQLGTIYRRDLSRGTMFLKASTQPALGTVVRIDLELPSASVIELIGVIVKHVVDPQRGTGVDIKLDPLPTKSVWMIESALAADSKVRAQTGGDPAEAARPSEMSDGEQVATAEAELIRALEAEVESLRKLNPFLVLGLGYETTDADVRRAFGELTKRYHPDRFARYQSEKLRHIAAEIFILIRDAYRKLADERNRQQATAALKQKPRAQSEPRAVGPPQKSAAIPRVAVPSARQTAHNSPTTPAPLGKTATHDAPTNPSNKPAELAHTELARGEGLAIPIEKTPPPALVITDKLPQSPRRAGDPVDVSAIEVLIEAAKLDEALAQYRALSKKHPQDRGVRAGIELCEGLVALEARDRLEAAQRFETALELDPSNERAARALADMRRHATNERKGLLSRLMGKKEPPP